MSHFSRFPRPSRLRIFARLVFTTLLLTVGNGLHAAEVQPPFGLVWDEPSLDLERAVIGANARIIERRKESGGMELWVLDGVQQLALQRVTLLLREARLAAVELQYGKPDWTAANYDTFIQSVRQRIEEKHGPGTLIARKQDSAEHGVLQTLLGYRWESPEGSLELVYFAAQNPANLYRSVSLRYAGPQPEPPAEKDKLGSTATSLIPVGDPLKPEKPR